MKRLFHSVIGNPYLVNRRRLGDKQGPQRPFKRRVFVAQRDSNLDKNQYRETGFQQSLTALLQVHRNQVGLNR